MTEKNNSETAAETDTTSGEPAPDETLLTWSTLPARERPLVAGLVAVFVLILAFLVYTWTASWFFVALTFLVLWGSLSQFFVRTKFTFTERKVRVQYIVNKVEKEWSQYRSFYVDKNGVLLSPFLRPSRLENFRGLYVRFADNRDEVLNVIKQKIIVPDDDPDEI